MSPRSRTAMPCPRRAAMLAGVALVLLPRRARAQTAPAVQPLVLLEDAPAIAGIRLGDTLEQVLAALGAPDPSVVPEDPDAAVRSLSFRGGALLTLVGRAEGVVRIMLMRKEAGDIAGVRVGDDWTAMLAAWGEPPSGNAATGFYPMGDWFVAVGVDAAAHRVTRLMLALATAHTQPTDLPPPAWIKGASHTP